MSDNEIAVVEAIEKHNGYHSWVAVQLIEAETGIDRNTINDVLKDLHKKRMLKDVQFLGSDTPALFRLR